MLNYLGAAPRPQAGATMPGGIPGTGGMFDPTLSPQAAQSFSNPSALMGSLGAPPPAMMSPDDPAGQRYSAETQEDGSVLLRLKNPDGSMGPVVKIVPPIKRSNKVAA